MLSVRSACVCAYVLSACVLSVCVLSVCVHANIYIAASSHLVLTQVQYSDSTAAFRLTVITVAFVKREEGR